MEEKVDILVATYKPNITFLEQQIESILNQTHKNIHIIISDDCSGDENVEKVLKQYAKKDERINFYVQEKNLGYIKNFEFKPHEKVARIVCGCDGGSVLDATTLNILLLTTANRIVRLPGFYYDPANWGHSPLANVVQVELMEYWLDYWLWYFKVDYCHDIKIVVDSASADLINQFNYSSKYHAVSTGAKDVIIDMRNLQNVYTVPNYFITVNAGYIDPISLPQKTSNGYASSNFRMLGDNDMLIVEELSLIMDEKTNKPVDGNDHMTDGMKYAIKGL